MPAVDVCPLATGEPSYEIVADRAYDHIEAAALSTLPGGGLLYHGSLALRGEVSTAAVRALREQIDAAVFVDVNLRDPSWDVQRVRAMMDGATSAMVGQRGATVDDAGFYAAFVRVWGL